MSPPRNYVTTPAVSAAAEVKSAREYLDARITKVSSAPLSSERAVRSLQISSVPSYFTFVRTRAPTTLLVSSHLIRKRPAAYLPLHMFPSLFFINFSTHVRYFRPPVLAAHRTRTLASCLFFDNTRLYIHARFISPFSRVTFSCFFFFLISLFSLCFSSQIRDISCWINQSRQ